MTERLRAAVPALREVELRSARDIRALSLAIFDRSFAVTYVLEAIAIVVGLFGVAATYTGQALARAREFGMLRHLGVTRAQIVRLFAIESGLLIAVGVAWGGALGVLIAVVLVHRVNPQSFHWTMEMHWPGPAAGRERRRVDRTGDRGGGTGRTLSRRRVADTCSAGGLVSRRRRLWLASGLLAGGPFAWRIAAPFARSAGAPVAALLTVPSASATDSAAPAPGRTFAAVVPGRRLTFPRDHGAHPEYRTEWWYITGWVDLDGVETGVQITFFRSGTGHSSTNPSRFAPRRSCCWPTPRWRALPTPACATTSAARGWAPPTPGCRAPTPG